MEFLIKRERSTNFNKSEVRLLKELVAKHRTIIDNKKNDAVTNKQKEAAWNKIGALFNAVTSSIARSTKSLKLKYESIRKETKKAMEKRRQELYKMSGGPSSDPDCTDIKGKVMAIRSITDLDAHNDSDSLSDQDDFSLQVPQENISYETENGVFDAQEPVQMQNNEVKKTQKENFCSSCNSNVLKFNIGPGLKPGNEKKVTAKLDQLKSARLELVALQKEIATKEHLQVKYEHKLKIRNLENDERRKQEIHELLVRQLKNGVHYETNILDINTTKN